MVEVDVPTVRAQPYRVLYLIDQLASFDAGAEGVLLKLTRALPDRYRPVVGTFNIWYYRRVREQFACPLHVFPMDRAVSSAALRSGLQLRRLIWSERMAIVHTFFEASDLWGGLVATLSGCPVRISSRRDMGIQRSSKHDLAYRLARPLFTQVQTVSDAVRDLVIRRDGLDERQVITVHNGIDLAAVQAAHATVEFRASLGLNGASHVICDVGWIRRVKGADVLVRAAAKVCREFPNAVFVVMGSVGDTRFFDDLQAMIRDASVVDNFRFLDASERVLDLFKMSEVFCHLSRSDGLSNALLEAMASGVACVATRVGGNPEAIEDGRTGFLVPSEDPDA